MVFTAFSPNWDFHKNPMTQFWENYWLTDWLTGWLTDWLTDWKWWLHRTTFCLKVNVWQYLGGCLVGLIKIIENHSNIFFCARYHFKKHGQVYEHSKFLVLNCSKKNTWFYSSLSLLSSTESFWFWC